MSDEKCSKVAISLPADVAAWIERARRQANVTRSRFILMHLQSAFEARKKD